VISSSIKSIDRQTDKGSAPLFKRAQVLCQHGRGLITTSHCRQTGEIPAPQLLVTKFTLMPLGQKFVDVVSVEPKA